MLFFFFVLSFSSLSSLSLLQSVSPVLSCRDIFISLVFEILYAIKSFVVLLWFIVCVCVCV